MWKAGTLLAVTAARLLGQTAGVQVNSTCEIGVCDAGVSTITNGTASTNLNFTYTFSNGDQYLITGSLSGTDTSNSYGSLTAPFVVEYTGPYATSIGTDVLAVEIFWNYSNVFTSFSFSETVRGQFAGSVTGSSTVTGQDIFGGNVVPQLGPFSPPGAFNMTVSSGTLTGLSNPLLVELVRTYTFGAGTPIGGQITNGTASPVAPPPAPPPGTPAPPSLFLTIAGLGGLVFLMRRRVLRA